MNTPQNILIAGIAGQGVIFSSEVLCNLLFSKEIFLKKCDSYGFAQRGGSVISQIRIHHQKIFSPIIPSQTCTQAILLHDGQREFVEEKLSPQGKIYQLTQEEIDFAKIKNTELSTVINIYLLAKFLSHVYPALLQNLKNYLQKKSPPHLWEQNKSAIILAQSWMGKSSFLQIKQFPIVL